MVPRIPIALALCASLTQCVSAQSNSAVLTSTISSSIAFESSRSISISSLATNGSLTTSSAAASSTTERLTAIAGQPTTGSGRNASSTTSARPRASNTTPCNGYPEFCARRYSNISMVVAHNSPFVRPHNAASNQIYPVLNQLNDGIRGLSFETQQPNSTSGVRLCHTSCDLLDVGTLDSYLSTVKGWLDSHPYEVVTIMIGNNNGHDTRIALSDYVASFQNSGMIKYVWTPPALAMNLTDWPTLGEMILKNQRVVVTMDSGTDQSKVPWILTELNYQWTTPFSPTDPAFPCTQSEPSGQAEAVSRNRMYLMNHNLNIDISIGGMSILVPAYGLLGQVNAVSGNGSLGLNVQGCEKMWGRPPNWLLVDYYNFGNFNGSVFQVAATANNVSYDRSSCCGSNASSDASIMKLPLALVLFWTFLISMV